MFKIRQKTAKYLFRKDRLKKLASGDVTSTFESTFFVLQSSPAYDRINLDLCRLEISFPKTAKTEEKQKMLQ